MKTKRILFIKRTDTNSKFILNDIAILSSKYPVKLRNVKISDNFYIILSLFAEFIYLIFNVRRFKLIYIWFADYHSFFPVLLCKIFSIKCIICAGGYESTYIPEINTGVFVNNSMRQKIRLFCVKYSLNNCDKILTVDDTLIRNTNNYIYSDIPNKKPLEDGIKYFLPNLKAEIQAIHLGYDPDLFKKESSVKKQYSVLTAGLIVNDFEYRRKGIDLLIQAAEIMTDVNFIFVGLSDEYYKYFFELNLKNIYPVKRVNYEELIKIYSESKVFAQISMFEGMPSTICEAMLCECIPVGSNVNGIPKIIGEFGYIVKNKDILEVVDKLYLALNSNEEMGRDARKHIIKTFPLDKRKRELINILDNL